MAITILKIVLVLCVLIIPIRGPSKRREKEWNIRVDKEMPRSNYGVNEDGILEELFNEKNNK